MKMPQQNASTEAHLDFAAHTEGAVEAWKDAEIITPEQQSVVAEVGVLVGTAVEDLRARAATTDLAARATRKARARFGVRDVVLDLRVNATSDGVLNGPAQRRRDHVVFKQVFLGATANDIVRAKPRVEPDLAVRLHERLGQAPDFPGRATLLSDLGDAVAQSLTARQALVDVEKEEVKASDAERLARLAFRETIQKAYGMLLAAFPGRKAFVETFFARPTERRAAAEEDDAPAENEAPAGANG